MGVGAIELKAGYRQSGAAGFHSAVSDFYRISYVNKSKLTNKV